ncbi:hypothetical protein HBA43_11200 [Providencia rettgeri]|uniref:Uncharacterized protein n=1 Tax=Providencia huashanensis TaxID=3037798 RepID=A0AA42K311_9GAMM|nr:MULTISPECIES: hypothetical protein [Providencia]EJD6370669.1 hypothetical protein [Providencia rettgeri]EJD6375123.1 hypothetical protein [Providencia rettgeri]EJD6409515.1 hypothetical protein [Providencia rettgeri]EJD6412297.1 hypothetical protein [Providencia rettgeri]EJD6507704.1 hypothetical protein [Providencia rettgeri]
MGIYIIEIVPKDISYIPSRNEQNKIVEFLTRYGVEKNQVEHKVSNGIQCHVNPYGSENIKCPHCEERIEMTWVYDILSEVYDSNSMEFHLKDIQKVRYSPCCQKPISLDSLNYDGILSFSIYSASLEGGDVWNLIAMDFPEKINYELVEFIGFPAEVLMIRM